MFDQLPLISRKLLTFALEHTGTRARKAGSYANRDPALCWDDIDWFMSITKLPIVLKGVATAEDALLAAKKGVAAVILSNHGGRNLDTSRSGIEILPEVMKALRSEGLHKKMEVWVDGGVRRGTDILKALALGATAVGVGKPAVYSMSAYVVLFRRARISTRSRFNYVTRIFHSLTRK